MALPKAAEQHPDTSRVPPEITADQLFNVPDTPYVCRICKCEFWSYDRLMDHWEDSHSDEEFAMLDDEAETA